MIHDQVKNFKLYFEEDFWNEAFDFIRLATVETEEKRYELTYGMYAVVESYKL